MGFENLQISEPLKNALTRSVQSGRFPHAVILEDEDDERLLATAKTLAAALVCTGEDKPCGRCHACLKARSDSHPDIRIYYPDKKTENFKVDTVRELRSDTYIVANEAERKVYILVGAQNMLPAAQNALLKVLEEPPEGVCFLLLTSDKNLFLQTVLSRCVVFSQGEGKKADDKVLAVAQEIVKAIPSAYEYDLLAATAIFEKDKSLLKGVLTVLPEYFRAAVLIKSGADAPEEYRQAAQTLAGGVSVGNLMKLIDCTNGLMSSLEKSENYTLLVTRLCAEIRRASGR